MSPAESEDHDPQFWGYRERTHAYLRYLIFERGLNPCHPLVTSYEPHLYLTTGHAEYTRAQELSPPGLDDLALRTVCYRGADLSFRFCNRVATSLYEEDIEGFDPRKSAGWENRNRQGKEWGEEGNICNREWREKDREERRRRENGGNRNNGGKKY